MAAPYPDLSTVNATTDLSALLVYMNDLTDGYFMLMILIAFFLVCLLSSFYMQARFTGRGRFDLSFTVSTFATFGLSVLMSARNGLLNPLWVIITFTLFVLGLVWLFLARE